ncbi:MAG: acyl carrier protein [Flavobacteriales bacterium]|nr:acyl carrier protein [Flavobacteriales bacterium]
MTKEELKIQLKEQIISYLNLMDVTPEDFADDTEFFGSELGLDSIDSLELVVLLEREYSIKIENPAEGRKVLVDINHMADYILEKGKV